MIWGSYLVKNVIQSRNENKVYRFQGDEYCSSDYSLFSKLHVITLKSLLLIYYSNELENVGLITQQPDGNIKMYLIIVVSLEKFRFYSTLRFRPSVTPRGGF